MANYWIEDYESGTWPLWEHKDAIIKRCIEIIKDRNKVRIGYVIFEEMKLQASKSDAVEILSALEETGKYQSRVIKYEDSSDFIVTRVPKKPLKERYWLIADIIKIAMGGLIGYLISRL